MEYVTMRQDHAAKIALCFLNPGVVPKPAFLLVAMFAVSGRCRSRLPEQGHPTANKRIIIDCA